MAIDLHDLADQVTDEESFLRFVAALAADWKAEQAIEAVAPPGLGSPGALGWENGSIGAMLDAAVRWGEESINDLKYYEKPANPWRRAADILLAGKYYE